MKKLLLPLVLCMLCAPALADVMPGYGLLRNRMNAIRTYNLTQGGGGGCYGIGSMSHIIDAVGVMLVSYDHDKDETPGGFTLGGSNLAPTSGNGIGTGNFLLFRSWDEPTEFPELLKVSSHWQTHVTGGWDDGDFNRDGFIDTADLACVAGHWQNTVESEAGSVEITEPFSATGHWQNTSLSDIETSDLAMITGHWQEGVTAVPEPSIIIMLILGAISLLALRRR